MKYSNYSMFSSKFMHEGLDAAIKHTLDLGLCAVEHIENVLSDEYKKKLTSVEQAREMRRKLDENALTVSCYSAVANLNADNAEEQVEALYRNIEYAAIIGSPFVHHTLVPGYNPADMTSSREEMLKKIADRAERVAKRCNEYGMVCLYEPQGLYFNGVSGVRAIINEMRSRGAEVGVCGDTGNSIFVDSMPVEIFREFKNDIKHIHIKDYYYGILPNGKNTSFKGKTLSPAPFGKGNIGVVDALMLVPEYGGVLSLEFSDTDEEVKRTLGVVNGLFGDKCGA